MGSINVCKTRLLTPIQASTALRRSVEINPANAIEQPVLAGNGRRGGQRRLALVHCVIELAPTECAVTGRRTST